MPTSTTPKPGTFGVNGLVFPFSPTWLYTGVLDMTADFTFTGGTLQNGSSWTSYKYYYLDGVSSYTSVGGGSTNFGKQVCKNLPHTYVCFAVPVLRTYAKNTGNPTTSDKFEFYWWLYRYPQSTSGILTGFALSLTGSRTGINIGNPCNDFHLGTGPLLIVFGKTPSSNTGSFMFPSPRLYTPYNAAAVGMTLTTQAGYSNPNRNNQFEFTSAGDAKFLAQPQPLPSKTRWSWTGSATSTTGGTLSQSYLPIMEMTY